MAAVIALADNDAGQGMDLDTAVDFLRGCTVGWAAWAARLPLLLRTLQSTIHSNRECQG